MERSRNRKKLVIFMLMFSIASLSIGFAAFSATLNISSQASITPNSDTFSVKFSTNKDSLVVGAVTPSSKTSGITTSDGIIDNSTNPTIKGLSATFTQPGQYVEYTFYARNEGEYTAFLNSINFIRGKVCIAESETTDSLMNSACESIQVRINVGNNLYSETTTVTGHSLAQGTGETIYIRIEYLSGGTQADGPFSISLPSIALIYSTTEITTVTPPTRYPNKNTTLYQKVSSGAVSDADLDFSLSPETGKYIVTGTESNEYPIYYYRGAVENNNVLFANFCWKIVRTTNKGGTKLIYNGTSTADNKCLGTNSTIGTSVFNNSSTNVADVSYIYDDGTESEIKKIIENWYESNMTAYTSQLEDTEWCNDKSIASVESGGTQYYGPNIRNSTKLRPDLSCNPQYQLTVSSSNQLTKLNYPIALLTADELNLAGMYTGDGTYLDNNTRWWTLSPKAYFFGYAHLFGGREDGSLGAVSADFAEEHVRPSISLKVGTTTSSGDGSSSAPYIVQ